MRGLGNCLKNKKWKKTQVLTDIKSFDKCVRVFFNSVLQMLIDENLSELDIYNLYFKKSEVNKFRQKSNY